ncbi:MAG: alkaline phosphatase family protein [Solirubrobacteraceae bacterium]
MSNTLRVLAAVGVTALALGGCGAKTRPPTQKAAPPKAALRGGAQPRIAVIVMENEGFTDIIGSSDAPYINGLARTYGLASQSYAITHPSLPNYLALTGGSTFGIDSDCTDCSVSAPGIATQMDRAGTSWKAYMEDLPHPCFKGSDANNYAQRHDPFIYYRDVRDSPARCANIVPLTRLAADERTRTMPSFSWISPNLCHDMHDCSIATGDRFLGGLVPPLLAALGPHGLLVLTWDEGTGDDGCCRLAHGGHIVTSLAGGAAARRATLPTPVDHYAVLQTIEDLLGLPRLRGAACPCTPSLAPLLAR